MVAANRDMSSISSIFMVFAVLSDRSDNGP